jgi:type I restriction enzyme S subunit
MFPSRTVVLSIAATIAASGILGFDSCFPDSLIGVQGKPGKTTQEFLLFFFRSIASRLAAQAPQLAQKNINLRILNDLEIPIPPIEHQELLSQVVSHVCSIMEENEGSRRKLTLLWEILLNRSFSGDLTATWREAHMKELVAEMEEQAKYLAPHRTHSQRENAALQESLF